MGLGCWVRRLLGCQLLIGTRALTCFGWLCGSLCAGAGQNIEFRKFAIKLLVQGFIVGSVGSLAAVVGAQSLPLGFASGKLKDLKASNCTRPLYDSVVDTVRTPFTRSGCYVCVGLLPCTHVTLPCDFVCVSLQSTGPTYYFMALLITVSAMNSVYNALLYAFRDFSFLLKLGVLNFVVSVPLQLLVRCPVSGVTALCTPHAWLLGLQAFVAIRSLFSIMFASSVSSVISLVVYIWRFHFRLMPRLPPVRRDAGPGALRSVTYLCVA